MNISLTGRTELVEEGTSVLLTCDFYPSPINRYKTTWYRRPGSFQTELNRTMDLQSYTVNNPQQMTTYACEIDPVKDCFNNAASPTGPIITIYLKERYSKLLITDSTSLLSLLHVLFLCSNANDNKGSRLYTSQQWQWWCV